ncbi:MAG: TlpA disulfide reductase family protein [Kofleriaceae bacterium]
MAPAPQRTGVALDMRVLVVGGGVALLGIVMLAFFIWMVPNAARREQINACAGLHSTPPINKALCPNGGNCDYPIMAPDFTALDHNGKPVKLSDYRGKTVLLNFWASWCGVCEYEKPHLLKMAQELSGDDFVVIALASDRNWADILVAIINALAPDSWRTEYPQANSANELVRLVRLYPTQADHILAAIAQKDQALAMTVANAVKQAPAPTLQEVLPVYKRALPKGVPFDVLMDVPNGDDNIGKIAASWGIKAVPESALIDKQGRLRGYFDNKRDWDLPVAATCLRSVIEE